MALLGVGVFNPSKEKGVSLRRAWQSPCGSAKKHRLPYEETFGAVAARGPSGAGAVYFPGIPGRAVKGWKDLP